ncbi:MAG: dihydrofolate reductase family protein [Spirochaetia bacterium]|jgi:dihydrofolate reductase
MRRLFLFNMVTLDGFFAGPKGELDWHNVDKEFNEFAVEQLREIETLVFGRVTYELMAGYWPTPTALKNDPVVAEKMNGLAKLVFSRTLRGVEWSNSRLVKGDPVAEISKLKSQQGKALAIFGSANLAAGLQEAGAIDELRIMVNPVILGSGKPLFRNGNSRLPLKLAGSRAFRSGNVLLTYIR